MAKDRKGPGGAPIWWTAAVAVLTLGSDRDATCLALVWQSAIAASASSCLPLRRHRTMLELLEASRFQCSCRLYRSWHFTALRSQSRSVRTNARYAPHSDDSSIAGDTYPMRPSGLATPREVHASLGMCVWVLTVLEVGTLSQSVRGRPRECEEGLVCGVRATARYRYGQCS